MSFVDVVAVVRRHKLLILVGLVVVLMGALSSSYRQEGTGLVGRTKPYFETTAVVAVKPGALEPTTTAAPATVVPSTATPAAVVPSTADSNATADPNATTTVAPSADPNATTTVVPPTTVPTPPLAALNDVIDSRSLYYSALSLKSIVVSPGFAEAVRARAPTAHGSITAVVAQDTNTIVIVVDGPTRATASDTIEGALAELQSVVTAYATSPATRFGLDGVLVSAPSTPKTVSSIKDPLTAALVLLVGVVVLWLVVRAIDSVQLHKKRLRRRREQARAELARASSMEPSAQVPSRNGQHRDHDHEPVPSP